MKINKIYSYYFSPSGTTRKITEELNKSFNLPIDTCDLLKNPLHEDIHISSNDLCIISLPVYMGRIPSICIDMVNKIKSNKSLAIGVVVYGNREYEDALVELTDLLTNNNFTIVGAGAFIAQHSIFSSVGNGRPDDSDLKLIKSFGENCNKIIESLNNDAFSRLEINIKGNRPYRLTKPLPLKPKSKNTCNNCGLCYRICPTNSILKDSPKEINKDTCISCGACISNCPSNSKYFGGIMYKIAKVKFEKSNSVYKIPEVFYIC